MTLLTDIGFDRKYVGRGHPFEFFSKILEEKPNDSAILFRLGEIYSTQLRDYRLALNFYGKYKEVKGNKLDKDDPVHSRIQTTKAKLDMAEQLAKEQQEQERLQRIAEEKKRKTLEEAKKQEKSGSSETKKKLDDLIQDNEQITNEVNKDSSNSASTAEEKKETAQAPEKSKKTLQKKNSSEKASKGKDSKPSSPKSE